MISLPYYYLGYTGSKATLPASLADLPQMRYIDLRYNRLKGTIPNEIADMPKLKGLDLSHNSLVGTPHDHRTIGP
jgi:Leucine-rich repeat (LRR) protein